MSDKASLTREQDRRNGHPYGRPLSLLNAEIAARNRDDVNAAVALFADAATFQGAACQPCVGKAGTAQTFQSLATDHWQITASNNQVTGNSVTGRFTATSESIRAIGGVQRITGTESLTANNGIIVAVTTQLDPSDPQTAQFLAAAQNRTTTLPSTGTGKNAYAPTRLWEYFVIGSFTVGLLLAGLGIERRGAKRSTVA